MGEYVGASVEVIKVIGGPIKRYYNYLCCFDANIRNLRDEATKLDEAKVGLEGRVDAATRNIQVIVPAVMTWLNDVSKIQAERTGIEAEIGDMGSGCLAMKSRFVLSRKATKMAAAMKELQGHGNFGEICHPPPPLAAVAPISHRQTSELQSRKHLEDGIMATLREKKVSVVGICGMGGVGKTTMANKIMSRARGEALFDEIVMVVVSQPVDMLRIQREIAESLGLKLEVVTLPTGAHLLGNRLRNDMNKLIVLDDLWKEIDLEDLGIPQQRECTILLTSRNRDVFRAMDVDKCFEMETLEFEEAWSLFKEKVGASAANDPTLFPLAQEIVRECKGLPIALATVGVALNDKKSKATWSDAVRDLKCGYPQDIPYFLERVYNPLKLSYELLHSEHAKLIFLMCCLFPEDSNIPISDLSLYALGLNIFEGIISLQDARNKVQTLAEMLKSRSLLLYNYKDGYVKMHDVVRDVGIFIAGTKGLIDSNLSSKSDCTWISLFNNAVKMELPPPNLRLLLMEGPFSWTKVEEEDLPLSDNFFESATKLNVLSIRNYKFRSLSNIVQLQKNLRTLILVLCSFLGDISIVGELVSLEVLYCYGCESVKELPIEIGRLSQLKLLNVSNCRNLETIAAGVISRLISLEELTLINSFRKWEAVEGGENAALCELNCLSSLTTLRIQTDNASLAAQLIHLSPYLAEFRVEVGRHRGFFFDRFYGRKVKLALEREVMVGDWIHQLLRTTECLHLKGEGATKLMLTNSFINLQELWLENMPKLQHLGNDYLLRLKRISVKDCSMLEQVMLWDGEQSTHNRPACITFPKLEELTLSDLPRLTSFCKGIQNIDFPLLTQMWINKCPNMKNLVSPGAIKHDEDESLQFFCKSKVTFGRLQQLTILDGYESTSSQVSGLCCDQISKDLSATLVDLTISNCGNISSLFSLTVATKFVNLQSINIRSCSKLIQLVSWNEEENSRITFPKLVNLHVSNLPKLTFFCKGVQSIEFPLLTKMGIVECPDLKSVISSMENGCKDEDSLHLFCKPDQAAFGRLQRLRIDGYGYGLWCDQIPMDFLSGLVDLEVSNCGNIKSLISLSTATNLLVNLETIKVRSCSMLEQVVLLNEDESSRYHHRVNFPKLTKVVVEDLSSLTSFCIGIQSIEFPSLTEMEIRKCPNLKSLVSSTENDHKKCSGTINHDADDSLHLFCKSQAAFGRLQRLDIYGYGYGLWCDQIPMDFLTGLVDLEVSNCGNIKSLFSLSIATNFLVNLKTIKVRSCSMLEQVVLLNEEESSRDHRSLTFPKVMEVVLNDLLRLTSFCKGIQSIEFPSLTEMEIRKCPNLKSLVSSTEDDHKNCFGAINHDADDPLHLFCKSQVAIGRLKVLTIDVRDGYDDCSERICVSSLWCHLIPIDFFTGLHYLYISNCGNIKTLFSPTIAQNLINLRLLSIERCGEMVKVIEDEVESNSSSSSSPLFIKLETLDLTYLPKLKSFCDWRCALHLPSLREVSIRECPEMERFLFGSFTTPNLVYIIKDLKRIIINKSGLIEPYSVW